MKDYYKHILEESAPSKTKWTRVFEVVDGQQRIERCWSLQD